MYILTIVQDRKRQMQSGARVRARGGYMRARFLLHAHMRTRTLTYVTCVGVVGRRVLTEFSSTHD